jgi:hypothetical protein
MKEAIRLSGNLACESAVAVEVCAYADLAPIVPLRAVVNAKDVCSHGGGKNADSGEQHAEKIHRRLNLSRNTSEKGPFRLNPE